MSNYTDNGHQDDWGGLYPAEARNAQNDSFREMEGQQFWICKKFVPKSFFKISYWLLAVMRQINQDWEEMTSEDVS